MHIYYKIVLSWLCIKILSFTKLVLHFIVFFIYILNNNVFLLKEIKSLARALIIQTISSPVHYCSTAFQRFQHGNNNSKNTIYAIKLNTQDTEFTLL